MSVGGCRLTVDWAALLKHPTTKPELVAQKSTYMRNGRMVSITSSWMGPLRQVLCKISGEFRDHDSITVQCPHDGRADRGLRFQAGPPSWHWTRRGQLGWPLVYLCFCNRCETAMGQYSDREADSRELLSPATEGGASPLDQPVTGSASRFASEAGK